ncbi:putative Cytochrome c-type biogenesis protein cycH [Bradyrhizobium sp. STM 3843]|uniref:c-type cytochrome biogenesis protein CcmI n=1 Tax=Bradyrhizobium sp. STM 3843 TaxID=551947 RepID=UPI00024046AC|nr:c-type cytochrome biogenesis protein CcmI [Bradyrhizobium sp. STM 3843]CCE09836.1 putative Cytochrome c-type biogenesis protein cycH [Bradyrhizobium sp. STM 3843]
MMLWLVLTAMISAAAVLISTPFIRRFERAQLASAQGVAVYRDQLREIEAEAERGLIDETEAEGATIEIKRRILAANRADEATASPLTSSERKFALTVVTGIVVFGSVVLYAMIGSPDVPSASPGQAGNEPAARSVADVRSVATTQGAASSQPAAAQDSQGRTPQKSGLPPVEEMIQRVQTRLERNPKDVDGWRLLGWSLFNIERFADAAQAYARAIELRSDSAEYRSARGEALVRAADGTVTAAAKKELDEALRLDPKDARARFFVGLAKEQDGNKEGAIADWKAIISDADPNEPWLPDLKRRLAELGEDQAPASSSPDLSAERMQELLRSDQAKSSTETAAPRGPSQEDVRAAQGMSPQDRGAMIRGMVDNLASRLEQSPRDAEGWIKLIRSRVVLGEAELARQSLQRALSVFSDDSEERTRIAETAKQLGVDP